MSENSLTWLQKLYSRRTVRAMDRAFERGAQRAACTRQLQRGLRGLRFDDPELEREFRRRYTDLHIGRIRAAIVLAIALVAMAAVLDLLTAPDSMRTTLFVEKLLLMLPIPLVTLWISYHPRHYQRVSYAMCFAIVCAGVMLAGVATQAGVDGFLMTNTPQLLLIVYTYFVSALLWPACLITALLVSVAAIAGDVVVGLPRADLTAHLMHLFAANCIGIVGSFMLERVSRLDYLHAGSASEMADIDRVTSLRSAASFDRRLARWWDKATQRGRPIGLLLIDLDYFKRFDESCGHYAAERALRAIAQSIQDLRSTQECFLARMDDDGFGVIMRDANGPALESLASDIRGSIAGLHLQHPDSPISSELTASIAGRVVQPRAEDEPSSLSAQVRLDLERLKRCDRNSVWIDVAEDLLPPDPTEKVTPFRRQSV